jgi:uncharacterized protein YegL
MASKANDVVEGFNAYISGLRQEQEVNYLFSLTLFDTAVTYPAVAIPLDQVQPLDHKSYRPGGNTALNDAIGITVRKVENDNPRVDKIVTVIMTDGEENSSREWSLNAVRALIEQKESEGQWTFIFMGASPDAWAQGHALGVRAGNVAQYQTSQYLATFEAMAEGTRQMAARPKGSFADVLGGIPAALLEKAGLKVSGKSKK